MPNNKGRYLDRIFNIFMIHSNEWMHISDIMKYAQMNDYMLIKSAMDILLSKGVIERKINVYRLKED